jgi:glucose-1-phosphate cytidylyltransferase
MVKDLKQIVILAGGKGTRMRELTETIPKPMVEIGGKPVLEHLIKIFDNFSNFEYILCTGYKSEIIEEYFESRKNVKIVNTGEETNTGGRLYKVSDMLQDNFLITYGDGLANVNISELIDFHYSNNEIGTITVTNPVSRFGLVEFDEERIVNKFVEKPKLSGFINIGFMVFNKEILKYLNENSTLESDPLINLSNDNELKAFVHNGYFEPMDTYREYLNLNKLWDSGEKPWLNFSD